MLTLSGQNDAPFNRQQTGTSSQRDGIESALRTRTEAFVLMCHEQR